MKVSRFLTALFVFCTLLFATTDAALADGPVAFDVVGSWEGTLTVPGASLRVIFHIEKADDGTLTAKLDSPDQGAYGIPFDSATFEEGTLTLKVAQIDGSYVGTASEENDTIDGTWTQMGNALPLVLKRVASQ